MTESKLVSSYVEEEAVKDQLLVMKGFDMKFLVGIFPAYVNFRTV
jgi:hypothetical protein